MDRRQFVMMGGTLAAAATLGSAEAGAKAEPVRRWPINTGWRYSPKPLAGGHDAAFDDSGLETVVVPHTNIALPWHNFDDKAYEFVSLYRRRFRLPAQAKGKHVFVDFEGVMTAATVWINGRRLGEYKGGYTPFSFDLTPYVDFERDNVLAVDVDSTERSDIPPFGHQVDYMTFGGIYREVALRLVADSFLDNIFAKPKDVLSGRPALDVDCRLRHFGPARGARLDVVLTDGRTALAKASAPVPDAAAAGEAVVTVAFAPIAGIKLWSLTDPKLYTVEVRLMRGAEVLDVDRRRIGFRQAAFTDHGFELNGTPVKLVGLDRHQTFPFVGQAMGARGQRHDAWILRKDLKCNIVRTSHYPQSRHFLDACDELGLLVLEEIPGWQHIGDRAWQDISVDNVERMIARDCNHPSIVLWGVRINESADNHDFYVRTNALAHRLDPTRQTGGIRNRYDSEFLEDVFTMNDFPWPPQPPRHPRYLNTEFCGHMYPVKPIDNNERQLQFTVRHARMHDWMRSNPQYAGAIGWCAFDYNTHADFGSGDRICYHGVLDIFRNPKPAAGFYKSQCEPQEGIVLEPAFSGWAPGDEDEHMKVAMFCSNCDRLKFYAMRDNAWKPVGEAGPDRAQFPHLRHPPFSWPVIDAIGWEWSDLKVEGYVQGALVATRYFSGRGVSDRLELKADDPELVADGMDATRVAIRIVDAYGNVRPYANDAVVMALEGPADLIGDNPFSLCGGVGAVWIRARQTPGIVRLAVKHARFGVQTATVKILASSVTEI